MKPKFDLTTREQEPESKKMKPISFRYANTNAEEIEEWEKISWMLPEVSYIFYKEPNGNKDTSGKKVNQGAEAGSYR